MGGSAGAGVEGQGRPVQRVLPCCEAPALLGTCPRVKAASGSSAEAPSLTHFIPQPPIRRKGCVDMAAAAG